MGGVPYWYFTTYAGSVERSLEELRRAEFLAGRYEPAMRTFPSDPSVARLQFPIDPSAPSPGAQHATIEEAFEAAGADGTRSILDILHVSSDESVDLAARAALHLERAAQMSGDPEAQLRALEARLRPPRSSAGGGWRTSYPLAADTRRALFDTEAPTRGQVERALLEGTLELDFWDGIHRGTARHVVVYAGGQPTEVFFAGYSFD